MLTLSTLGAPLNYGADIYFANAKKAQDSRNILSLEINLNGQFLEKS